MVVLLLAWSVCGEEGRRCREFVRVCGFLFLEREDRRLVGMAFVSPGVGSGSSKRRIGLVSCPRSLVVSVGTRDGRERGLRVVLRDRDGAGQLDEENLRGVKGLSEKEKCYLVGVDVPRSKNLFGIEDSLSELGQLSETAGMEVVGQAIQRLQAPISSTYIGSGKVKEVKAGMAAAGAKTCVFDDELSPAQQRTLERAFGGEAAGICIAIRRSGRVASTFFEKRIELGLLCFTLRNQSAG